MLCEISFIWATCLCTLPDTVSSDYKAARLHAVNFIYRNTWMFIVPGACVYTQLRQFLEWSLITATHGRLKTVTCAKISARAYGCRLLQRY